MDQNGRFDARCDELQDEHFASLAAVPKFLTDGILSWTMEEAETEDSKPKDGAFNRLHRFHRAPSDPLSPGAGTTFMVLPNEVLSQIMKFGSEPDPSLPDMLPKEFVKACRLVNRRLCGIADAFLVPVVRVSICPSSLATLESISQHPSIGGSVRKVQFDLYRYYEDLSADIENFEAFCYNLVAMAVQFLDRGRWTGFGKGKVEVDGWDFETFEEVLEQMRTFKQYWMILANSSHPNADRVSAPENQTWEFVRVQHQKYQRHYSEQQGFLENDSFFKRVALAMARMPLAKTVQFSDLDITQQLLKPFPFAKTKGKPMNAVQDILGETGFLIQPEPFLYGVVEREQPALLFPFIAQLIGAMGKEGHLPTTVYIDIVRTAGQYGNIDLAPAAYLDGKPELRYQISLGLRQLETLSLRAEDYLSVAHKQPTADTLLAPFLDSPRLRAFHMRNFRESMYYPHNEVQPFEPIGRVLAAKPRSMLRVLNLWGVNLRETELETLFKGIPHRMKRLKLSHVFLETGTWAAVLDLLRQADCAEKSLARPSGGEILRLVTNDQYIRVFESRLLVDEFHDSGYLWSDVSLAEEYIQGADLRNPIGTLELGEDVFETMEREVTEMSACISMLKSLT